MRCGLLQRTIPASVCRAPQKWLNIKFGNSRNIALDGSPYPPMVRGRGLDVAFVHLYNYLQTFYDCIRPKFTKYHNRQFSDKDHKYKMLSKHRHLSIRSDGAVVSCCGLEFCLFIVVLVDSISSLSCLHDNNIYCDITIWVVLLPYLGSRVESRPNPIRV